MTEYCNFCNKTQHQVKQLVMGEKVGICDLCIDLCSNIINGEVQEETGLTSIPNVDPIELKAYLDLYVTSQDRTKEILSVAVANHVKRINSKDVVLEKSNLIMLGPTGSGKTLLAKTTAQYLDVPFVIADATTLTESGYVGEDVESILVKLLHSANGILADAERGIVFIDEIDKIAKSGTTTTAGKEPGSVGVQQALLKLVEGTKFTIMPSAKSDETTDMDTKNILFIASGAFIGLDKIKKRKHHPSQIGFTADVNNKNEQLAESEDLIEYGLIPEFVSRFPIITEVQKLSSADMFEVLSNVENNLVTQYKHLFKCDNVRLTFDKEALRQVVNIAITKKTGARCLRAIMEKTLLPHMFNISKYTADDINKVRITKSLITEPKELKKRE